MLLKTMMKDAGEWKERSTAKKPVKDKLYQRTLKVIEWLKVC